MSNTYFIANGDSNAVITVTATGHDGFAHALVTGTSTDDTIEAVATSATTSALITLEGTVDGGSVTAVGNAQVAIDGAILSAVALQTIGAAAEIGVTGGGTATVTDATVVKGSYIYDNGTLTFAGGAAQANVTFLAFGTQAASGALTLSNTTFGAGDGLFADRGGLLVVSAAPDGTITFSAGTVVGATSNSTIEIDGGVANSGTMAALAVSRDSVEAHINILGGTTGTFSNAKHGLVEAEAISGYQGEADVTISAGGSAVNDGTMLAVAGVGHRDGAQISLTADTFTNDKGAKVAETAAADGSASLNILGSSGVTNLGAITGAASHDSDHDPVTIETKGGPIVNAGTISVAATTSSFEGLIINDNKVTGGSLTNAKGASITVTATTGSDADFSVDINPHGALNNSGTILFAASNDSDVSATSGDFQAGSVINTGNITLRATNDSYADNHGLAITGSGGSLTNTGGTIDTVATASSTAYAYSKGLFSSGGTAGGDLTNTGAMQAIAVTSSHAEEGWDMNGEGADGSGNLINTKTMGASATTDSTAEFYVDFYASGSNTGTIAATANSKSQAHVELEQGGVFTNNNTVTASETGSSYAETEISVVGSGGSGASITNNSIMKAAGNAIGEAHLLLSAGSTSGASIVNAGSITATAIAGARAEADVFIDGNYASMGNFGTLGAIAAGGTAYLEVDAMGTSNTITNTKSIIEAVANGGTAYTKIGGNGAAGAVVNNSDGALLAKETAGTAFLDLGDYQANVSGGTLTTVGPHAYLGVFESNAASATNVTITAKSQIVGWDGTLDLADILGSISAGTLVQAAKSGEVNITGNLSNSGTIEALASNRFGGGTVNINDGAGASTITNSGTIEAFVTSGNDSDAEVSVSAGTVTNARKGTIEALATAESYGPSASANFVNVSGTSIINSGTILASAKDSSRDAVTVSGGTVTNAATGQIEAIATDQSDAVAYIFGSTTNAGLIEAQGDADSEASVYLSGTVNNSAGTIAAVGNAVIFLGNNGVSDSAFVTSGTLQTVGPDAAALVTDSAAGTLNTVYIAPRSLVLVEDHGTLTLEGGTVIGNNMKGTKAATVDAYEGSGNIVVSSTIYNFGALVAGGGADMTGAGGTVTITTGATLSGPGEIGWVDIDEFGTVNVLSGGSANVAFGDATSGTLEIADGVGSASVYDGTVAGWGGIGGQLPGQIIELDNRDGASFADYSATYVSMTSNTNPNLVTGTLTVTSGGSTAAVITLEGNYVSGATFTFFDDNGNIGISDPSGPVTVASTPVTLASIANPPPSLINTTGASNVALLGNYMASMFAATEGGVTPTASEGAQNQTSLAAAHHT